MNNAVIIFSGNKCRASLFEKSINERAKKNPTRDLEYEMAADNNIITIPGIVTAVHLLSLFSSRNAIPETRPNWEKIMNISGVTRVDPILGKGMMDALHGMYKRNLSAHGDLKTMNVRKLARPNRDTVKDITKISRILFLKIFSSLRIEKAIIKSAIKYSKPIKSGRLVLIFFEKRQENRFTTTSIPSAARILPDGKCHFLNISAWNSHIRKNKANKISAYWILLPSGDGLGRHMRGRSIINKENNKSSIFLNLASGACVLENLSISYYNAG